MILNLLNNKRYVGSAARSLSSRWSEHKSKLRNGTHRTPPLQNAWNKYGENAFQFVVLENTAPEKALEAEDKWHNLFKEQGIPLYNCREHVDSQLGMRHTDEAKLKMSIAQKRATFRTAEYWDKIRKARKGYKPVKAIETIIKDWPELVAPDGTSHTIRNLAKFCEEHELDVSAMRKVALGKRPIYKGWRLATQKSSQTPFNGKVREYNKPHTLIAPDGQIFNDVTNLEEFAKQHNLDPSGLRRVCVGETRSHKGWKGYREGYTPKTDNKSVAQAHRREWPTLIDPEGQPHQTDNLYQFCKQHGLDKAAMQRVVSGKSHAHKGWHLA